MIIKCEQCNKKFEIESTLIPEKGRLLQCSSCTHQWFYKKDILEETEVVIKKQDIKSKKNEPPVEEINNIKVFEDLAPAKEKKRKHSYKSIQTENKKLSFLNVILVFIISIIALIVLLDTFKSPISLMIPNIEFILESLYETLKDILLFIQDLL
jgi:predicted Zn finger-like uncharacterized protein|tara:strand:- start:60 stop:521 length:462 start_codon:yes stop_codon:yes gene_type:complete